MKNKSIENKTSLVLNKVEKALDKIGDEENVEIINFIATKYERGWVLQTVSREK